MSNNESLKMRCFFGSSVLSHNQVATTNNGNDTEYIQDPIYYVQGSCITEYNQDNVVQNDCSNLGPLIHSKSISCVAVSKNGTYLAIGERGADSQCIIWNMLTSLASNRRIQSMIATGYKNGVGSLAFSPSAAYIITVGFKNDRTLIGWNVENGSQLFTYKISNKVLSITFHHSGNYFATCGDKHLKYWYTNSFLASSTLQSLSTEHDNNTNLTCLSGKPAAILEEHSQFTFMQSCFGKLDYSNNLFCVTSNGTVCRFSDSRTIEKFYHIEGVANGYCISWIEINDSVSGLVVGLSNGVVRILSPTTLETLLSIPLPKPLPKFDQLADTMYPSCYAICATNSRHSLVCFYADKSINEWKLEANYITSLESSQSAIMKEIPITSRQYHSSCVWEVQFLRSPRQKQSSLLPYFTHSFSTCSSDETIRIWEGMEPAYLVRCAHAQLDDSIGGSIEESESIHNLSLIGSATSEAHDSTESITVQTPKSISSSSKCKGEYTLYSGIPDTENPQLIQSKYAPRCLAEHPVAPHLVCGDRSGTLSVYDISTYEPLKTIKSHSGEILTIHFSMPLLCTINADCGYEWHIDESSASEESMTPKPFLVLIASGGRDRLIHIYDASTTTSGGRNDCNYSLITTLDFHASSVTAVRFSSDGRRLVTCGGDNTMLIFSVNGPEIKLLKSIQTPHLSISSLAIETSNKFAVTCGQDKRLVVWNLLTGKLMRVYKNKTSAEFYKCDVDPSGMYVVTGGSDKVIRLFDFFSGEELCTAYGHGDLVTGVKFSPDGQLLVSVGADGCVISWQLSEHMTKTINDRLVELKVLQQKRYGKLHGTLSNLSISGEKAELNFKMPADIPVDDPKSKMLKEMPTSTESAQVNIIGVDTSRKISHYVSQSTQSLPHPSPTRVIIATDSSPTSKSANSRAKPPVTLDTTSSVTDRKENRWLAQGSTSTSGSSASKINQGSYELFGKKIVPGKIDSNINHFTLELTQGYEKTWRDPQSTTTKLKPELISNDDMVMGSISVDNDQADITEENVQLETSFHNDDVGDEVILDVDDGDNGDPSDMHIFKVNNTASEGYDSDFIGMEDREEKSLMEKSARLEDLEKSARNLETWLESLIRQEGQLEGGQPSMALLPGKIIDSSSHQQIDSIRSMQVDRDRDDLETLPPPPAYLLDESVLLEKSHYDYDDYDDNIDASQTTATSSFMDAKRKETVAAVLQMKERLKNMGILNKSEEGESSDILPWSIKNRQTRHSAVGNISTDTYLKDPVNMEESGSGLSVSMLTEDTSLLLPQFHRALHEVPLHPARRMQTDSEPEKTEYRPPVPPRPNEPIASSSSSILPSLESTGPVEINIVQVSRVSGKQLETSPAEPPIHGDHTSADVNANANLEGRDTHLRQKAEKFKQAFSEFDRQQKFILSSYKDLLTSRNDYLNSSAQLTLISAGRNCPLNGSSGSMDYESVASEALSETDSILQYVKNAMLNIAQSLNESQQITVCMNPAHVLLHSIDRSVQKPVGQVDGVDFDKSVILESILETAASASDVSKQANQYSSTKSNNFLNSLNSSLSETDVASVLEKYSDRLVDLVTEKLLKGKSTAAAIDMEP